MIEEIGNKYTPADLKDKINELINNYCKFTCRIHTVIDHKCKALQNEIKQKQAKNDKKCYKRSDMCYGVDTSKIENKQSKLDEAEIFRNNNFTWMNNRHKLSLPVIEEIGELSWKYRQATKEIIQQKDEEIFRLKSAIIDQSNNFRNERNQREKEYEILKQQNPKIDDDLKKWLKSWDAEIACGFTSKYNTDADRKNMKKLKQQLGID
jgi:hypothetical protein